MSDRTLTYGIGEREHNSVPGLVLTLFFIGVCTYFLGGQFYAEPLLLLLPIGAFALLGYSLNKESMLVATLVLTITLVQLKAEHGEFTIYDALAGIVLTGGMILIFFRSALAPERYRVGSNQYSLFIIYFIWISVVGIANFTFGDGPVESWFRDILLLSPLAILPPLVQVMQTKRDKRIFFGVMLIIWVIGFIISFVRVRSSFLEATYLFEVSYQMVNGLNGPLMLIVFFNLFLFEKGRRRRRYLFLIGMIISVGAIILTHNRTFWVLTPVGVVLSVLFATPEQRKRAFKLIFQLFMILAVLFTIGYFTIPLFRIVFKLFTSYFLSSSNLKTDPSLIGRYVEWRYIWKAIQDSPIVGYGMGSTFHTYNWFGGYSYESAYTHNGYLGVLQKGGIVGFIIFFSAYLGFVKQAWTLLRTKVIEDTPRALLKSGLVMLVLLLVATNTANIFAHRDVMMYVGIIWGYILYIKRINGKERAPAAPGELPPEGEAA